MFPLLKLVCEEIWTDQIVSEEMTEMLTSLSAYVTKKTHEYQFEIFQLNE